MNVVVTDDKDRELLVINENGQVAVSRYEGLTEEQKNLLIGIFSELTGEDVTDFLEFDDENTIFCS